MVNPRMLMNSISFLTALEEFSVILANYLIKVLVDLWNGDMVKAMDMIASRHPLPWSRAGLTHCFTGKLAATISVE